MSTKPYGAANSDGRFERWIELFKLRYVHEGHCIHWLKHISCPKRGCSSSVDWMDHVSGYTNKKGELILMAQPYGLNVEDLESIAKIVHENDLRVSVHGGGWFGQNTVCVDLRAKEKR